VLSANSDVDPLKKKQKLLTAKSTKTIYLHLCDVKFLNLAFNLGVVFAIFGFLWGIFQFLLNLLRMGKKPTIGEYYVWKFIQYFFLVNVTFLFSLEDETSNLILINELILSGLILVLYFSGKFQNKQMQDQLFQVSSRNPMFKSMFSTKAEIAVISLALGAFIAFSFLPEYAKNPISMWFYESIIDIETTPVFGFIFKIIGFFVLLGILFKLVNGFFYLISGGPLISIRSAIKTKKESDFDDYEELK
jgi:hypothetical protein